MTTKHEQILAYIENLPVGDKISVRQIAKDLSVSEGTAYRAIKEAENRRIVSTIERVGTIRIELKKKEHFERLTFAEVVNIVDGQVLGGKAGLYKTLNKFVIGAMQLEDMMRYVEPSNLLIVGNRLKVHETALKAGAAVLITGGFDVLDHTKKLADELELPVISTSYDTFTVATMINRAIDDQLIKKDVLLIEDIYVPLEDTYYLYATDQVKQYRDLNNITTHGGFPVVDRANKLVGIVTARDVIGKNSNEIIEKVMTKNPISITMKTSVASASHRMIWEGIDLLPVVKDSNYLVGVISRQDVLKALQAASRQPQNGETIDDIVKQQIKVVSSEEFIFEFVVTPQMTDHYGAMSYGAFTILLTETGAQTLKIRKRGESVVENMTIYFTKPIQLESILRIQARLLEMSRKVAKMDIEVFNDKQLVGKAMVTYQLLER
ncbi:MULTISPECIES: DRTGG domain-containing protein [Psychrobacillus]|uniref:CBS domain-containing protein n=1 Tax=Psychrobacillus faecigallinarum TaxID=2762235 RepID=A0ABR8R6X6_9BACI|nr:MULTISPECIES: DRTGG domain-containing protein [Psychrobacillus]MBD7943558.1 CBS domain-containing protein [Psychrobacillus faecigallinarum]QEY22712.1 CBS domain-containing protein [Psychrobacillus sp. AK 1817]QGM29583.1 CBS domain-containing protein [Bacillus sp. N3536]